jgi:hypothetical protein
MSLLSRSLLTALACAACLAAAAAASATTLVPATLTDVVNGSQLIVHGRVSDVEARTTADRRSIYRVVTLTVDDALKGGVGRTVTFRVPGGQMGRYRRVVVGAPSFAVGEEVVVFLRGGGAAIPSLVGLSQGVYKVTQAEPARRFLTQVRTMTRSAQ